MKTKSMLRCVLPYLVPSVACFAVGYSTAMYMRAPHGSGNFLALRQECIDKLPGAKYRMGVSDPDNSCGERYRHVLDE